jgi:CRISPR-associated protein Cas1
MDRLVIDGWGKYIGTDHEQIIVKERKDGTNTVIHRCIPQDLRQVVISGKGSISTDAIELLAEHGVDVVLIDWRGQVTAYISPPQMRTVNTRREQYRAFDTPAGAVLAKEFINAKLHNMSATLGTLAKSRKDTFPESAENLKNARDAVNIWVEKLEGLSIKGKTCNDVRETIMGFEGNASASYWQSILEIIPAEFGFKERSGRYAADPVNAMLNYGYGVLEGECWRAVHYSGLDPYGGFLHVDRPGKASMIFDLMEEFRQQVVDKSVIKIFSLGQVKPGDFTIENGVCKMADDARKLLLNELLTKLESQMRYEDKNIKWTDLILDQARDVAQFLRGESRTYKGFWLRW